MTTRDWTAGEVAVLGLGKSGLAASALLRMLGARVYVSDAGDAHSVRANAEAVRATGAQAETGGTTLSALPGRRWWW